MRLRAHIIADMKSKTATAHVFGKEVLGLVVSCPGDEGRGIDGTWHIVGTGGQRHPLDTGTFATKREAVAALAAFEV